MIVDYVNRRNRNNPRNVCYVHENIFEQTKAEIETRAEPVGIEIRYFSSPDEFIKEEAAAIVLQYPDAEGDISHIDFPVDSFTSEGIGGAEEHTSGFQSRGDPVAQLLLD